MAAVKTEDVKLTSIRYPGEDLGIWTILRGFFMILSFFGILGSITGEFPFSTLLLWLLMFALLSPYYNLKLKEKTGVGITRGLKIVILMVLFVVAGQMMEGKAAAKTTTQDQVSSVQTQQNVDVPKTTQTKNPEITDKTVGDVILTFVGSDTELTDLQKKEEFTKYKYKYIQGSGIVKEVQTVALSDSIVVGSESPTNEFLRGATLYFKGSEKDKLLKISKGDEITFYGQIADYGNFMGLIIREAEVR